MTRTAELAEGIEKAIQDAYDAGKIKTFDDFAYGFMEAWDDLEINNNRLRGSVRQTVQVQSPVFRALKQQEKEIYRPITGDSPIDHLPIPVRVYNALYRAEIRNVSHLLDVLRTKGREGLIHQYGGIRNIGGEGADEIYEALEWAGIEIPPQSEPEESETMPMYGHNMELPEEEERELIARGAGVKEREIILDDGETFKTEIFPENSGEIVIIGHKRLTIRARRITIEAFG